MIKDYVIEELIPQRTPIIMVDELVSVNKNEAVTSFVVKESNMFLNGDGFLKETGIIEHIAQSASAMYGYESRSCGNRNAPIGYIGEVKNFKCKRYPRIGEILTTTIIKGVEINGVTNIIGIVCVADEVVAQTQLKIFINEQVYGV